MNKYFFIPHRAGALNVFEIGAESCAPCHSFSTALADRFLIHYIISGKGTFSTGGKSYSLSAGSAFLIGSRYGYYEADKKDPWTYTWINISGDAAVYFLKSAGLSADSPVYKTSDKELIERCVSQMLAAAETDEFSLLGAVFNLLGAMRTSNARHVSVSDDKPSSARYVELCREFIHTNYYKNISTADVCAAAGLEYSYVFRLFKENTGTSPGRYLTDYRLSRAEFLLNETSMNIGEISAAVGYEDRTAFSKAFAKRTGMSPKNYRARKKIEY